MSAPRQRLIRRDRTLEVVGFHAGDQANLFQRRELLPGFGGIAEHQIKFAEVLMGAAVAPVEQYGQLIMLHRRYQLTQPAISIADVILDIGVARVAQRRELERRDRSIPILGDQRLFACCEIRVELRVSASDPIIDPMTVQMGQSSLSSFAAGARSDAPSQTVTALRQRDSPAA